MILIFGGAYQGKREYALERFGTENKKIIYDIDKWILELIKSDIDVAEALNKFIEDNSDAIVICNDISCGIVPIDAEQRKWREAVGRSLAMLSGKSDEVIRLFCGIPTRIK